MLSTFQDPVPSPRPGTGTGTQQESKMPSTYVPSDDQRQILGERSCTNGNSGHSNKPSVKQIGHNPVPFAGATQTLAGMLPRTPQCNNDYDEFDAFSVGMLASALAKVHFKRNERYRMTRDHNRQIQKKQQQCQSVELPQDSEESLDAKNCTPAASWQSSHSAGPPAHRGSKSASSNPKITLEGNQTEQLQVVSYSSSLSFACASENARGKSAVDPLAGKHVSTSTSSGLESILPNSTKGESATTSASFTPLFYNCRANEVITALNTYDRDLVDITDENNNEEQGDYVPPISFGYFCQETSSTTTNSMHLAKALSPARATFEQVLPEGSGNTFEDRCNNKVEPSDKKIDSEDDEASVSWIPLVRCVAEPTTGTTVGNILTPQQKQQIARHVLPKNIASCKWKRLYSLARDGDSFDVCLHRAQGYAKTLMVIRTSRGAIVGGFAGEAWNKEMARRNSYYGNNETCLFTFENGENSNLAVAATKGNNTDPSEQHAPETLPHLQRIRNSLVDAYDEDEADELLSPPIQVFKYTGINRYIQYCDEGRRMMAFGGGGDDGSFGLCVQHEFQRGSTGVCDTFGNKALTEETFTILDLELWSFLTGEF